jgi:hypothetical protein
MVARYHHVQILEVKAAEYLHSMYVATVSEPILMGSIKDNSVWVHAKDELDAWKKVREFLDGKR